MGNLRECLLIGIGNPLLDISATVENNFLQKFDLKPNNAILAEAKHLPMYNEIETQYKAEYIAGGSVQNSLRVCQWILRKPNVTAFFGCVGYDNHSAKLEDKAREDGVNVQYQYTSDSPTGTCGVLITGTHRSLCANLGAANNFTVDHLRSESNRNLIENAKFFYISGFFVTVSPESIMEIAKFAQINDRIFIMNLSAPFISEYFKDPLMTALPYVDILFGNETEAEAFSTANNWLTKDIKEIGKKIIALPKINKRPRIVILTQGSLPVLLITEDSIKEFSVDKLSVDKVVDTNGAGDAFVGGFLAQYIQGKQLNICIKCGIWSARQIIQRSGCTFSGEPEFAE